MVCRPGKLCRDVSTHFCFNRTTCGGTQGRECHACDPARHAMHANHPPVQGRWGWRGLCHRGACGDAGEAGCALAAAAQLPPAGAHLGLLPTWAGERGFPICPPELWAPTCCSSCWAPLLLTPNSQLPAFAAHESAYQHCTACPPSCTWAKPPSCSHALPHCCLCCLCCRQAQRRKLSSTRQFTASLCSCSTTWSSLHCRRLRRSTTFCPLPQRLPRCSRCILGRRCHR